MWDQFRAAFQTAKKHPHRRTALQPLIDLLNRYGLHPDVTTVTIRAEVTRVRDVKRIFNANPGVKYRGALDALELELNAEDSRLIREAQDLAARRLVEREAALRQERERQEALRLAAERREAAQRAALERRTASLVACRDLLVSATTAFEKVKQDVIAPYTLERTVVANQMKLEPLSRNDGRGNEVNDVDPRTKVLRTRQVMGDIVKVNVVRTGAVNLECTDVLAGPPPDYSAQDITGESAEMVMELGRRAIFLARALCPRGTFNNSSIRVNDRGEPVDTNGDVTDDSHTWIHSYNVPNDEVSWYIAKGDTMFAELSGLNADKPKSFVEMIASYGYSTFFNQGGVCAQMSALTMGILSMLAPAGTTICQIYHGYDHNFCLARRDDTEWFSIDPWPLQTHVVPMKYCCFPRVSIHNHTLVRVRNPVELPLGVAFARKEIENAKAAAAKCKKPTKGMLGEETHEWTHTGSLDDHNREVQEWKRINSLVIGLKAREADGAFFKQVGAWGPDILT